MGITTKDLARICGVSRTTVNRALHGTGRISEETKKRILETAHQMGYEPDLAARSLVLGKSGMIGAVVVDLRNQYFPKIVDAIQGRVQEEDYILNITLHEDDKEMEQKMIRMLIGHRVDGLILNPINKGRAFYEMIERIKIPYCLLSLDEFPECPSVGVDEYAAGVDSARYILAKGYRDVVFVAPPLYDSDGELNLGHHRRLAGFQEVMKANGCKHHVIHGQGREDDEYLSQVLAYFHQADRKVAFLCSGAMFAVDVNGMMRRQGFYAPQDYGLMTFDHIKDYQNWCPSLTALDNHVEGIGRSAGDLLLRMIRGEQTEQRIVIPHSIVDGQSL